jgi:hypothetical protein
MRRAQVESKADRIADPVGRLRYLRTAAPPLAPPPHKPVKTWIHLLPLLFVLLVASGFLLRARIEVEPLPAFTRLGPPPASAAQPVPDVWRVEQGRDFEIYSNGLRIENRYAASTHLRSYHRFAVEDPAGAETPGTKDPVGIVFHTTESQLVPFEARNGRNLKLIGAELLEFVARHRAYHFVIDRFGRVYRMVRESDAANHAGYSVWRDEHWVYVNLNESFLGISFEARTEPGQEAAGISPAQARSAAMLTEMLRSRYGIAAPNCVTHAQVSVNPSNMQIGYHRDWASGFPFKQIGLPDNYEEPLAALVVFGFDYEPDYVRWGGARLTRGLAAAEDAVRDAAARQGLAVGAYRSALRKMYRERFGAARHAEAEVGENSE